MPRIKKLKSELACYHILVRKDTKKRIFYIAKRDRVTVADLVDKGLDKYEQE